jgi:hypothetical protein
MTTEAKTAEARAKQSAASKAATLDLLKNKVRATRKFTLYLTNEEGEQIEVELKFRAIGLKEYDKLVSKHPPKPEQVADGATFNMETFAPALIAACSIEPEMEYTDAKALWDSPEWSRGDLMVLFRNAVDLNNRGLDIPFSESA